MLPCGDQELHNSLYVPAWTGLNANVIGCHCLTGWLVQSGRLINDLHQIQFIDGLIVML